MDRGAEVRQLPFNSVIALCPANIWEKCDITVSAQGGPSRRTATEVALWQDHPRDLQTSPAGVNSPVLKDEIMTGDLALRWL